MRSPLKASRAMRCSALLRLGRHRCRLRFRRWRHEVERHRMELLSAAQDRMLRCRGRDSGRVGDLREGFMMRAGAVRKVTTEPAQQRMFPLRRDIRAEQPRRVMHAHDATTALHHHIEVRKVLLRIRQPIGRKSIADENDRRSGVPQRLRAIPADDWWGRRQ